jgi:hypothetical protein
VVSSTLLARSDEVENEVETGAKVPFEVFADA